VRDRDCTDQRLSRDAERLADGQRAGQHVRCDVTRRQHGIHVECIDQFAVGERGAEDVDAVSCAHDRGPSASADQAPVLDADATFRLVDSCKRNTDRIQEDAFALVHHGSGQVLEARLGGEVGQLFNEGRVHGMVGCAFGSERAARPHHSQRRPLKCSVLWMAGAQSSRHRAGDEEHSDVRNGGYRALACPGPVLHRAPSDEETT
jgi:hypothetical protein